MLVKSDLFVLRDAISEDHNFILATFLRGLYYGDPSFKRLNKAKFMDHYHKIIENLLGEIDVNVKMAVLKDDPEVIIGYSIFKHTQLHWVFVKKAWRGIGIAKSLVPSHIMTASHLTTVGEAILKAHPALKITFDPFESN